MNKLKHFMDIDELSIKEIYEILELMSMLKKARYNDVVPKLLEGKTLAMIFEEPSTRTRVSFESAMTLLGGHAQYLKPGEIHLGKKESIYDTTKVLSRMTDGIFARVLKHETLLALAKYSDVPVFNGMSDISHPTQIFADLFTMFEVLTEEQKKNLKDVKVVFVGDASETGLICTSLVKMISKLGMNFVQIGPKKYQLSKEKIIKAKENIKKIGTGSILVTEDINKVKGAHFVVTDAYWWIDTVDEADERYKIFMPFQVNKSLMKIAGPQAKAMHCLPCSRNVELTDEVFDAPGSIIFDEAENRLTTQMALLVYYMYPQKIKSAAETKAYWKGKIDAFMNDKSRNWNKKYTYNNDYQVKFDYLKDLKNKND